MSLGKPATEMVFVVVTVQFLFICYYSFNFDRGWAMNISSISANFARKLFVDSQSRLMKSGNEKTKHNQMMDVDANLNAAQENSVAAYLLPGSPSMQNS